MVETQSQNHRLLGYARVSTYGQTLDAQLEQLRAEGCNKVYREKASGARADRRELMRLLKELVPGDVVILTRIDRLARSTFDLFAIVKRIVDAGAQFRSLAEPWADTATSTGRLMIAVLGGLADVERDLIRTRTAEGRARAKGRRTAYGSPPEADHGTARRGSRPPGTRRDFERTCPELRCEHVGDIPSNSPDISGVSGHGSDPRRMISTSSDVVGELSQQSNQYRCETT